MTDPEAGDESPVVTVFLRNRGEILLLRRSDEVRSYPGRWAAVSGHVEDTPDRTVWRGIDEETGLSDDALESVRAGDSFAVSDEGLDTTWRVHPYLFECDTREVETNWETDRSEWVPATAILERETVPALWDSYDHVRPRVQTVESDTDHGSTTLSIRALEVLRDEAAVAENEGGSADADGYEHVPSVARELLAARPAMTVVTNRVNRTMATAEKTPESVQSRAHEDIQRAYRVDGEAAENAVDYIDGARVATLSRSETVLRAIDHADVEAVLIAESRPGRDGIGVAEELAVDRFAGERSVSLTSDAEFAHQLHDWAADVLVVGADSILADGRLVNKVGTRSAAIAAQYDSVDVVVVTARDKVSSDTEYDLEARDAAEMYDGDSAVEVENNTFDATPADCIDAYVTEGGVVESGEIGTIAEEYAAFGDWQAD